MDSESNTPTSLCVTATRSEMFKFSSSEMSKKVKLQSLEVNLHKKRCFTPLKDIKSPGLSPIFSKPNFGSPVSSTNNSQYFNIPVNSSKNRELPSIQTTSSYLSDSLLDTSKGTGYLNHTLNVNLILKNVGLEQYEDAFEKEEIDFGKFLTMNSDDLMRLGLLSMEHQKIILDLLQELNS